MPFSYHPWRWLVIELNVPITAVMLLDHNSRELLVAAVMIKLDHPWVRVCERLQLRLKLVWLRAGG